MQPDPLSPQQEDKPHESLSTHDMGAIEPLPVPEQVHLEPTPVQEIVRLEPSPIHEMKRPKLNIAAIVLGILVFFLLIAAAALGYWGYTLNTKLTMTQQQFAALQGNHNKLQADYSALTSDREKLNTALTQAMADLEKANADLSAAQVDLHASQNQNQDLSSKITKAGKLVEILYSWSTMRVPSDIFAVDSLIKETKDQELIKKWNDLMTAPSDEGFGTFFEYLIAAAHDNLK